MIFDIKTGYFETNENIIIKNFQVPNSLICLNYCQKLEACQFLVSNASGCIIFSFYAQYYKRNDSKSVFYEKLNFKNFGLTNYWPIENGEARDLVASKNLYDAFNANYSQNRFGYTNSALSFYDGYIRAPSGIYFETEFTVLAWVRLRNYSSWQRFFDFGIGRDKDNVYFVLSSPAKEVLAKIYNKGSSISMRIPHILELNKWQHIGFTLKNRNMSIFVNGTRQRSTGFTFSGAESIIRHNNFFGKSNWYNYESPPGNFDCDEIKFFNKALEDSKIMNERVYGFH
ncbi:glycoside hydrolase [Brachionus plicatilis]|uniref:Glycoside hydrolase n=1 Tax=Brachionus plicatilis TaxID=10195 RepID=A0A3M7RJ20_BRAPC|nr:glycoside hydrolase [Brachionus plicatilis]